MIEIGLGLVAILFAAAIALGLTDGMVPFPLGSGAVATASIFGAALILRGAYRLAKRRAETDQFRLRSTGLMLTICGVVMVLALAMPGLSEPLSLFTVGGFPLGWLMMTNGLLALFAVLMFVFAAAQTRIDKTGGQP